MPPGRRAAPHLARRRATRWVLAGVGVAGAVALLAALLLLEPQAVPALASDEDPSLGRANATLTVFYYADFQCPYCRRFELDGAMDRLRSVHVENGRVRLVFKDFPIVGDDSWRAAEASEAVWRASPDAYWEWHRAVFLAQRGENDGWASAGRLVEITRTVEGADAAAVERALASGEGRAEVADDKARGLDHGVAGTPTLVVGSRVLNALDERRVEEAIADALG